MTARKPPWPGLLQTALRILNAASIDAEEWVMGGGTALALYFHHRESKDIDIFLTDAQRLLFLTPRTNSFAASLTGDYVEGASFIKLRFSEGEIDFIVAPHLTEKYRRARRVANKVIYVETPVEIVLKKLFYRAADLKVRDIVDVAVVFASQKQALLNCASLLISKLEVIEHRWSKLRDVYGRDIAGLAVTGDWAERAPALFEALLADLEKVATLT